MMQHAISLPNRLHPRDDSFAFRRSHSQIITMRDAKAIEPKDLVIASLRPVQIGAFVAAVVSTVFSWAASDSVL